ncbi:MAG: phospholipase D-like domain-containing protein [Rhizomicrobium sp.]
MHEFAGMDAAKVQERVLVASSIDGFHPKALFWKEQGGGTYALIGSSNLTNAAFKSNYEANVVSAIKATEYDRVRTWLVEIAESCEPVTRKWIRNYNRG